MPPSPCKVGVVGLRNRHYTMEVLLSFGAYSAALFLGGLLTAIRRYITESKRLERKVSQLHLWFLFQVLLPPILLIPFIFLFLFSTLLISTMFLLHLTDDRMRKCHLKCFFEQDDSLLWNTGNFLYTCHANTCHEAATPETFRRSEATKLYHRR